MRASPSAPRLSHLSPISQASILETLGRFATTLQHLRMFVAAIFAQSPNRISSCQSFAVPDIKFPSTKTAEAFADAVDGEVRKFEAWGAKTEEDMCRGGLGLLDKPLVVSLLSTEQSIRDAFDDSFEVLLSVVKDVFGYPTPSTVRQPRSPATLATALLDILFYRLQEHMERKALVTGATLLRVFISSSEPIWGMIGHWLRNGMSVSLPGEGQHPGELEEEFFIEYSGIGVGTMNMGLMDPDFWKEGYSLRETTSDWMDGQGTQDQRQSVVPTFLKHTAKLILGTGKAIGLVRVLGLPPSAHGFATWPSFSELVDSRSKRDEAGVGDASEMFSVSVDTLAEIIQDHLQAPCEATGAFLSWMFVEDCDLWSHIDAIEDLFLMRKGDALTHFLDVVFSKVRFSSPYIPESTLRRNIDGPQPILGRLPLLEHGFWRRCSVHCRTWDGTLDSTITSSVLLPRFKRQRQGNQPHSEGYRWAVRGICCALPFDVYLQTRGYPGLQRHLCLSSSASEGEACFGEDPHETGPLEDAQIQGGIETVLCHAESLELVFKVCAVARSARANMSD